MGYRAAAGTRRKPMWGEVRQGRGGRCHGARTASAEPGRSRRGGRGTWPDTAVRRPAPPPPTPLGVGGAGGAGAAWFLPPRFVAQSIGAAVGDLAGRAAP